MITKLFSNTLFLIVFVFFLCLMTGVVTVGSYSGITLDDFCDLVLVSFIPSLLVALCSALMWVCKL
ncbi:hypothetical protein [Escherichia coli phage phiS]